MADQKELAILELVAYGVALHAIASRPGEALVVGDDLAPEVPKAARALARHYVQFAQELEAKFGTLFHG